MPEVSRHIPTSEEISQMAKDIDAGLLDPDTWPLNCRVHGTTSLLSKRRYDKPTSPQQPEPKRARLVPLPEEDALAVEALLEAEKNREERLAMKATPIVSSHSLLEYPGFPYVPRDLRLKQLRKWVKANRKELPGCEAVEIDELIKAGKRIHLYPSLTRPRSDSSGLMEAAEEVIAMQDQMDVPLEVEQANALQNEMPDPSHQLVPGPHIEVAMPEDLQQLQTVALPSEEEKVLNVEEQLQPADIGDVQPKPKDQAECQQWLHKTSEILTSQYKSLLWEDRYQVDIDFEDEIEKEQQNHCMSRAHPSTLPENGWQQSYRSLLENFEDICEETAGEYRDPQAKRLRSKWSQRFGKGSRQNLCRKLDTKLPTVRSRLLLRFNIMSQRKRKTLETQTLRVELKYSRNFCTLHLNQTIDLKSAARKLPRLHYNDYINVLQGFENHHRHSEHSRVSWLWPNGTLTIINGCRDDKQDLMGIQDKLLAPILNVPHFKAAPGHNLQYLRMRSTAHFGQQINLKMFAQRFVLSTQTCRDEDNSEYVYYVTSEIPGVVAQLHDHGRVYVYAMTIQEADKLLVKLYTLIQNHCKDLVKVERN
ncbi:uncharacterized protein LOC117580205 [Drosophila guanche]|nr:uncharacterized protein LOC117580205 [Drosophila guanche]